LLYGFLSGGFLGRSKLLSFMSFARSLFSLRCFLLELLGLLIQIRINLTQNEDSTRHRIRHMDGVVILDITHDITDIGIGLASALQTRFERNHPISCVHSDGFIVSVGIA
jgi:hypothetical protein